MRTKLDIVAYRITDPANAKNADPTPLIAPSFFISIALLVIECANPVVGIIIPDLYFVISLSKIPIDVKSDAIKIIVNDIKLLILSELMCVIFFSIRNTVSHDKPNVPPDKNP